MEAILSVLTSRPAALAAEVAMVVLVIALTVTRLEIADRDHQIVSAQNTIGQLKGSLEFQNMAVEDLGKKSAQAAARAQGAIESSRAAHSGDAAMVAALLAKPIQTDPLLACQAADKSIMDMIK